MDAADCAKADDPVMPCISRAHDNKGHEHCNPDGFSHQDRSEITAPLGFVQSLAQTLKFLRIGKLFIQKLFL